MKTLLTEKLVNLEKSKNLALTDDSKCYVNM